MPPPRLTPARAWAWAIGAALLVCVAMAPTLTSLEFSSGSEDLNVATALEIGRTGHWLVPTLDGVPRLQKPPLTAWLTALFITPETHALLRSPDPLLREQGASALAWQARLVALLATGAMLVGVYWLGRILADDRLGLFAALATGSMLLVLRFGRMATTDTQLTLWVTLANVGLALAIVGRMPWRGWLLAGAGLGLAMMSKGPVGLVQTILPVALFVLWRRWAVRSDEPDAAPARQRTIPALLAGLLLMLLIGVSWYGLVLLRADDPSAVWRSWTSEVTRVGATDQEPDAWYTYAGLVPLALPWTVFFIVGLILLGGEMRRGSRQPMVLALFLLLVPLIVMSLFRDRQARYIQPLAVPAGLIVAWGLCAHWRSWARWGREDTITVTLHWITLGVICVGLPIAGALGIEGVRTIEGAPWYPMPLAVGAAIGGAVLVGLSILLHRRWRGGLVIGTAVGMLLAQVLFIAGYRHSDEGRSELRPLAETIWQTYPDAAIFNSDDTRRAPSDLSIYLDRSIPIDADAAQREPTDRPLILLRYQRHREPAPAAPPGWTWLDSASKGDNTWHAFVKPQPAGGAR